MSFTLSSSSAIIWKAGAGANSTIIASGAFMAKISDQAEGVLNGATKMDWITNYDSAGANYKPILDDAVSSIAAQNIINYDMSGYTSRSEAQTMLDLLRDAINRDIDILKDKDVQTKIGVI